MACLLWMPIQRSQSRDPELPAWYCRVAWHLAWKQWLLDAWFELMGCTAPVYWLVSWQTAWLQMACYSGLKGWPILLYIGFCKDGRVWCMSVWLEMLCSFKKNDIEFEKYLGSVCDNCLLPTWDELNIAGEMWLCLSGVWHMHERCMRDVLPVKWNAWEMLYHPSTLKPQFIHAHVCMHPSSNSQTQFKYRDVHICFRSNSQIQLIYTYVHSYFKQPST